MANRKTQAVYYRDPKGREPVREFLDDLARRNPRAAAKIDHYVDRHLDGKPLSAPPPNFPISSHVGKGVRELRIRSASSQYRVLYAQPDGPPVLLHALEKKTPRLPARDRELAISRLKDHCRRRGGEPPAAGLAAAPRRPRTR
jgi:phage-related protein